MANLELKDLPSGNGSLIGVDENGNAFKVEQKGVIGVYHNFDKTERVISWGTTDRVWEGSEITLIPKSANSKFLILFEPFYEMASPQHFRLRLFKNDTRQTDLENTGSANYGIGFANLNYDPNNNSTAQSDMKMVWDTPNTTDPITYDIRGANHSGNQTVAMNRFIGNYGSGVSKITIMEYL